MDRLNNLSTEYPPIDYEEWFKEIPEEDREKRIDLAKSIEEVFDWLFHLIVLMVATGEEIDTEYLTMSVQYRLFDLENVNVRYVSEHVVKMAGETVQTTVTNVDSDYFVSPQRASEIAADEAHTYFSYEELQQAWEDGFTRKSWNTQHDRRVRKTHREADGQTVRIDEMFHVGGYEMATVKDTENGAPLNEVAGCRCYVTFS